MSTTSSNTQNFNTLITSSSATFTDNSTIANWYSQRTGNGTTYVADAGSSTAGGLYSYGTGTNTDRALGTLGSSNAAAGNFAHGVLLRNTSGSTITSITVSYTLEQWRKGGVTTAQTISFYYKTSSLPITSLNPNDNATWTPVAGLNLSSPINTSGAVALDGNNATNKVSVSNVSIPNLSLANNNYIMLKWDDPDHTGTDQGIAIDDVTISWTVVPTVTAPSVTTIAASSINTTGATLNGTVSSNGAATTVTFNYGTTTSFGTNATAAQSPLASNASGTSVTAAISSLSVNTLYYFRVSGNNSQGTTDGSNLTFYTLANTPNAPTVNNPTASTLDVAIGGSDGNPSATEYAIQETGSSNYVQANGSLGVSAVWQTASTWGTKTVTGLAASTSYTFRVKARNGANTETAFGSTANNTTSAAATPNLGVTGTTAHGSVCPNVSASPITYTITNTGSTASNVVVSSNDPQFVVSGLSSTTIPASGTATYNVTFTPTSAGAKTATISVFYNTNTLATTSSLTGTGTTPVTATVTSSAATAVVNTTATLNGNVTALGVCPATTEKGFVYSLTSTNNNPQNGGTGVTKTSVADLTTGAFILGLTGLTPNTSYSFNSYVYDGTTYTYGTARTFTTLQVASKLAFGIAPPATGSVGTNLTTFTVQAQRPDNSIDAEYMANIVITKATGSGNISGTTTVAASAGTATFSAVQFDAADTYTITATSGGLATITSGNIVVTLSNSTTNTWITTGNTTAWMIGSNWNLNAIPSSTNVARFDVQGGNSILAGITFNSDFSILGIELTASRPRNLTIGGTGGSSGPNYYNVTLNGGVINLLPNVILRNASPFNLNLIPNSSGANYMNLVLGNNINNIVNIDGSGGITISAIISGIGRNLTKGGTGTGILTLSASNTYTGTTTISSGFINAVGESAFGANPVSFTANYITLNGGGIQSTTGNINFSSNRGITLGASGGTFDVATSRSITLENVVTGSGALTKTGVGSLFMTGQHTYTGLTTVSAGTLQLNRVGGTTLPITNNVTVSGGTLQVSSNQTLNNLVLSSGELTVDAGVTLTINGTLTYSGGTISGAGTIVYGSSGGIIYSATKTTGIEWAATNSPASVSVTAGTLTLGSNVTTTGNLTISGTALIVGTGFTLTVGGDWNSTSTATPTNGSGGYSHGANASSVVVLNGSGSRTFTHTGGAIFRNLTIAGTGTYIASNDISISVNTITISNGGLDMGTNSLNGTGNFTMSGGTIKFAKLNTTLPELDGTYNITGGTVELNGAGSQTLKSGTYNNLTFSNSGTKLTSGAVNSTVGTFTIQDAAIVNVSNNTFGGSTTNLTMTGTSRLIVSGARQVPDMEGTYTLTGGTIEFAGNNSNHTARGGSAITYNNIEISGLNVNGSSGNYNIAAGGSFTVATGAKFSVTDQEVVAAGTGVTVTINGTFSTSDADGFSGNANTSINATNITLSLGSSSTIEYARSGNQVLTPLGDYNNVILSGSGIKNAASAFTINGTLTLSGTASLGTTSPTYGASGTLAYVNSTDGVTYTEGLEWPNTNPPANVTVNLSGTTNPTVVITSNKTITGTLTLTAGILDISGRTLTFQNGNTPLLRTNGTITTNGLTNLVFGTMGNTGGNAFTIPNNLFTNATPSLANFTINRSNSLTLNNQFFNLIRKFDLQSGNLILPNNYIFTLKSTSILNTALVAPVGGTIAYGTGAAFMVERFIPKDITKNSGNGIRAFRDISPGLMPDADIFSTWQEGGINNNGFGTQITGKVGTPGTVDAITGLDLTTSGNPSLYSFNVSLSNGVPSWDNGFRKTKDTIASPFKGYRISIRGNRQNNLGINGIGLNNEVVLRSRGKLVTGTVRFTKDGVTASNDMSTTDVRLASSTTTSFTMVGNPYASPIDFIKLMDNNANAGIQRSCWVFDPNIGTAGAYVTYNTLVTANSNGESRVNRYVQPGQAFFIRNNGTTSPVLEIREEDKAVDDPNNLRDIFSEENPAPLHRINLTLLKNVNNVFTNMDGALLCFKNGFTNTRGAEDALKFENTGENIALANNGNYSIEGKAMPTVSDSTVVRIWKMESAAAYQLRIDLTGVSINGLQPILKDRFTKTQTVLPINTVYNYSFTTSADTNSFNNRFTIVYTNTTPLPVAFISVKSSQLNANNIIDWKVTESNIQHYTVEYTPQLSSAFSSIATINSNGSGTYQYTHVRATNYGGYYRIKATDYAGAIKYSSVVAITVQGNNATIQVYPNPVLLSNGLKLAFNAIATDNYTIQLVDNAGKLVYQTNVQHQTGQAIYTLPLPSSISAGNYQLKVIGKQIQHQQAIIIHP